MGCMAPQAVRGDQGASPSIRRGADGKLTEETEQSHLERTEELTPSGSSVKDQSCECVR